MVGLVQPATHCSRSQTNGFELGGSGLREVYRVWRSAQRRPPVVQSDEQHNRFRIELDSRPLKVVTDPFWKQRLGVTLCPKKQKSWDFWQCSFRHDSSRDLFGDGRSQPRCTGYVPTIRATATH